MTQKDGKQEGAELRPTPELLDQIATREWQMLQEVNQGGPRAECQDSPQTFKAMREGQFAVWSKSAAESYLQDLKDAEQTGRNLVREKYVNMMLLGQTCMNTDYLPLASPRRQKVVELSTSVADLLVQENTAILSRYPHLAPLMRPVEQAGDDQDHTSIETYLRGELLTYSETTLELLLQWVTQLEREGRDYAKQVLTNSLRFNGFRDLAQADAAVAHAQR